jgi:hypothetical protein
VDAVEIKSDPAVEHKTHAKHRVKTTEKAGATRLRVTMPDGTVIAEPKSTQTMCRVVQAIGVDRVRGLGMKLCKVPLIANTLDAKYGSTQLPLGNGWYVITHSSTVDKKKILDKIAKSLGLKMKVEIVG